MFVASRQQCSQSYITQNYIKTLKVVSSAKKRESLCLNTFVWTRTGEVCTGKKSLSVLYIVCEEDQSEKCMICHLSEQTRRLIFVGNKRYAMNKNHEAPRHLLPHPPSLHWTLLILQCEKLRSWLWMKQDIWEERSAVREATDHYAFVKKTGSPGKS